MPSSQNPSRAPSPRWRVLLIEDDPRDARLVRELIVDLDASIEVACAASMAEAAPKLRDPAFDVVLLDLHLPDSQGLEAVATAHAGCIGQPILVLTGTNESDLAVEALRMGAQEYLVKDRLDTETLGRAMRHAIERQRLLACMRDSVRASHSSEENLRRLLLMGTEALVVVGEGGQVHFANEQAELLYGRSAEQLMAQPLAVVAAPGREVEQEITRPDGSRVTCDTRCVAVMWGRHPALLLSLRDVSERRRAADQEVRLELLTSFLGHMSHELRTPLSAIYQFVSNVRDGVCGPVNGEQGQQLGAALRNVDEVLTMVSNLLDVARVQGGKLRVEPRVMSLRDEVESVRALHTRTAAAAGVQLLTVLPDSLPPLLADPARVRQVVSNLCENAIKFTPRGGTVRLEARHDPDAPCMRILVSDTGCGVPAEHLGQIFEELHQVPDTAYRTRRGLGLGLHITRELVRAMGGEITVQSQPGIGSEFEVILPVFDWVALLEPVRPALERSPDLHGLVVGVMWPATAADEPIPQAPLALLRDRITAASAGLPHVLVPAIASGDGLALGAVLVCARSEAARIVTAVSDAVRDDTQLSHSGLQIRVRAVRIASASRRLTLPEVAQSLGRMFDLPNSRGASCKTPA